MADFVEVIHRLKSTQPGAADSPVVAFGGSYGGMLTAWLRMKYPASVVGYALRLFIVVGWLWGSIVISELYKELYNLVALLCSFRFTEIVVFDIVIEFSKCISLLRACHHYILSYMRIYDYRLNNLVLFVSLILPPQSVIHAWSNYTHIQGPSRVCSNLAVWRFSRSRTFQCNRLK